MPLNIVDLASTGFDNFECSDDASWRKNDEQQEIILTKGIFLIPPTMNCIVRLESSDITLIVLSKKVVVVCPYEFTPTVISTEREVEYCGIPDGLFSS